MKNEKSIKTTRTTLTIIAIAIAVTVIALTTALLPNRATAQTKPDFNKTDVTEIIKNVTCSFTPVFEILLPETKTNK